MQLRISGHILFWELRDVINYGNISEPNVEYTTEDTAKFTFTALKLSTLQPEHKSLKAVWHEVSLKLPFLVTLSVSVSRWHRGTISFYYSHWGSRHPHHVFAKRRKLVKLLFQRLLSSFQLVLHAFKDIITCHNSPQLGEQQSHHAHCTHYQSKLAHRNTLQPIVISQTWKKLR